MTALSVALIVAYLGIGFGLTAGGAYLLGGEEHKPTDTPTPLVYTLIVLWPLWLVLLALMGIGYGAYRLAEVVAMRLASQGSVVMYLIRWPTRVINMLCDAGSDNTSPVVTLDNSFKRTRAPNGQDAYGVVCVVYRVTNFEQLQALRVSNYHVAWQGTNDCWCGRHHDWATAYDTSLTLPEPVGPDPTLLTRR